MKPTKSDGIALRKKGYSLNEISKRLGISKSTASLWVKDVRLSPTAKGIIDQKRSDARERAAITHRALKRQRMTDADAWALEVLERVKVSPDESRLICSLLYWCEGAKLRASGAFAFMNSDPNLVRTFMELLRGGFPIDESKLRLQVHLHDYHDHDVQLLFWSKLTNIPLSQCTKPYVKPHTGIRSRVGYQGCASIRYLDIQLGRKIEAIGKLFIEPKGP